MDEDSSTRGRLESFPQDPIHRLVGVVIPRPPLPNPADPANPIPQEPVAGGMAFPPTAGFDPIFYVHHSNIDRLWAEWSCMPGKNWGHFPPQDWFDDNPWHFYDVTLENGQLKPVEVSKSRKDYFDYRALGVSFKSEDLSKTPLPLPDPIPGPAPALLASLTSFANVGSFSAVKRDMQRAAALGCYFSVNAEMTRSDRGRILVTEMPLDRILTETDGPFTQMEGRPAEPADIRLTVASIADVRKIAADAVSDIIRANLQTLLKT